MAIRVPGVAAVLRRVVRHDPYRWAHRNVHYYDETLKSREEAREYGEPLAGAAGARSFTSWLRDSLDPRDLRAFARDLERRRDAGTAFPIPLQLTYAREDPTVKPDNGERLRELAAGRRVPLARAQLALRAGRQSRAPHGAAARLSRALTGSHLVLIFARQVLGLHVIRGATGVGWLDEVPGRGLAGRAVAEQ